MIDKISGVYGARTIGKVEAKKGGRLPNGEGRADGVELSSFAVTLAKVSGELKKLPDVREQLT